MSTLGRLTRTCSMTIKMKNLLGSAFLKRKFATTMMTAATTTTTSSNVIIEDRGQVRLIGINRPAVRNAINYVTACELKEAFERFEQDDSSVVAVLHGVGGSFCAGYDLTELSAVDDVAKAEKEFAKIVTRGPMGPSQMLLSKPVVAAVDGFAVAGGFELALWADLRVVETTAVLGVFCRRFGVPLIDGGTVRLAKLIGLSRAMDLILTGRGINGKEAFDFGIANRLVPVGTALGQAFNLANSLVKFPQECLRADRRSAYYAAFEARSLEEALEFEFTAGSPIIAKESIAGAKRFTHQGVGRHGKFVLDRISNDVDVSV